MNPIRLLFLILIVSLHAHAFAENEDGWQFRVTPYVWVTGQEGEVATFPSAPPAEIDVSFSDIIEHLDMTLMALVEGQKGRIGFFGEIFHTSIAVEADTPGAFFSGADYDQDLWGITLAGTYAMVQNTTSQLDAVAGVRFWDLDNTLKLTAGLLPAQKISFQEDWNDFFVALKGRKTLNERWFVTGWAAVAVAGDSDSSWDLFGGAGYRYSDTFALHVGYRHQVVDYEDGDFLYDVEMSGPIIGFTFQF